MCLYTITKRFNPPDPKVRKGWKFVEEGKDGQLHGIFQCGHGYSTEWQVRRGSMYPLKTNGDVREEYDTGFHVFPTREDARKAKRALMSRGWELLSTHSTVRLVKVEVRDVTCEGIDGTTSEGYYVEAEVRTLVAHSMRIVAVVKD